MITFLYIFYKPISCHLRTNDPIADGNTLQVKQIHFMNPYVYVLDNALFSNFKAFRSYKINLHRAHFIQRLPFLAVIENMLLSPTDKIEQVFF